MGLSPVQEGKGRNPNYLARSVCAKGYERCALQTGGVALILQAGFQG